MNSPADVVPVVFAAVADDRVAAEIEGRRRDFHAGQERKFVAAVGSKALVICDDAVALLHVLAGDGARQGTPLWKLFDACRVLDADVLDFALRRALAWCPAPPARPVRLRNADPVAALCGLVTGRCERLKVPFGRLAENPSGHGPLGAGHAARVAVALRRAERDATGLLASIANGIDEPLQPAGPRVPSAGDRPAMQRFLAERHARLADFWDEPPPKPADEDGLWAEDIRDWGPWGDADPDLVAARRDWAAERLRETRRVSGTAAGRGVRRNPSIAPAVRTGIDPAAARGGRTRTFAPGPGHVFLQVRLRHLRLRCLKALLHRRGIPAPWLLEVAWEGGDPIGRCLETQRWSEFFQAEPDLGRRLAPADRAAALARTVDGAIAGMSDLCLRAYVSRGLADSDGLTEHDVRRLRSEAEACGWFGLGAHRDPRVPRLLAELCGHADDELFPMPEEGSPPAEADPPAAGAGPFDGVDLTGNLAFPSISIAHALRTAFRPEDPQEDFATWERSVVRALLGDVAAGGGFWDVLTDRCAEDESRRRIAAIRQSKAEAKRHLRRHPCGLASRVGPSVPCWQAPAAEVEIVADEVRGMVAYALVRYDLGLVFVDGDEFVCRVPEGSAKATATRAAILVAEAVGSLLGRGPVSAPPAADVEILQAW